MSQKKKILNIIICMEIICIKDFPFILKNIDGMLDK